MDTPEPPTIEQPASETDALLDELHREIRRDRKIWRLVIGALAAYITIFIAYLCIFLAVIHRSPHKTFFQILYNVITFLLMLTIHGPLFSKCLRTNRRQNLVGRLSNDFRAVGPLAQLLALNQDEEVKTVARNAFKTLLPRLQVSDASLFSPDQKKALRKLLRSPDTELVLAILKALEQIGDADDIDAVSHVSLLYGGSKSVREAAWDCLSFLRVKAEQQQQRTTLLRPSDAVSAAPDTLLRPAAASANREGQEQLLRPLE